MPRGRGARGEDMRSIVWVGDDLLNKLVTVSKVLNKRT